MKRSELMRIATKPNTKLADHVQHWGLPKERLFPLDTRDLVKAAAVAFDDQARNMTPEQRLVCARSICKRAEDLGVVGYERSLAYKYAGADLSPHFHSFLSLRKTACAHTADAELDKLAEVANVIGAKSDLRERVEGLDKVAAALKDFDVRHGISHAWDTRLPDPAYSTFGLTFDPGESVEFVVKVADYNVRAEDLENADWERVHGKLPSEVIDGVKDADDKLAVFASLPDPEKEIIYQNLFMD